MFKYLLLALLALSATSFLLPLEAGPMTELLEGFNAQLNVENAADLDKCADIPLIHDINKTIHDLNTSNPNPIALVADVVALFGDYSSIKASCPEVAQSYEEYFSNFTQSMHQDPSQTFQTLYNNVLDNFDSIQQDIADYADDFKAENYYQAGEDFGKIVQVALEGFIPNSTLTYVYWT